MASKWRGDSEKLVRMLFELAVTNAPSIVFIDELEAILSERGCQGEHEASKRAKAEFLVHLEGIKSHYTRSSSDLVKKPMLFLASTNLPWTLDPAVLRRFQRIVNVKLPNKEEKMEIFKRCLKDVETSKIDFKALLSTKEIEYFSGLYCPVIFDSWTCWNASLPDTPQVQPCPHFVDWRWGPTKGSKSF